MENGFAKLFIWRNFLKVLEIFGGIYLILDVIFKYNLLKKLTDFQRGMIAGIILLFLILTTIRSLDERIVIIIKNGDKK